MVVRIGVVQTNNQTLFLCPCCSGQTDVLPGYTAHYCLRANDHYNRDIAITFGAQLLSFRACLRAGIAQQSTVSQFAKMLIMDYHSVCTALLLFLRVATAKLFCLKGIVSACRCAVPLAVQSTCRSWRSDFPPKLAISYRHMIK